MWGKLKEYYSKEGNKANRLGKHSILHAHIDDNFFNGGTVCRRRPDNRVNLGVWFTKLYLVRKIFVYSCLRTLRSRTLVFQGGGALCLANASQDIILQDKRQKDLVGVKRIS